jgi:hypothetical protein
LEEYQITIWQVVWNQRDKDEGTGARQAGWAQYWSESIKIKTKPGQTVRG